MSTRAQHVVSLTIGLLCALIADATLAEPTPTYKVPPHQVPTRSKVAATDCWEIHSLGTLGGTYSHGIDLNDAGQVTGNSQTEPRILDPIDPPVPLVRPFISAPNGGPITEILTLGYFGGYATAINEVGQVVGNTTVGRSFLTAYVTDPGGGNVRNTLGLSYARDINDVGQTLWDFIYNTSTPLIGSNEQTDPLGTGLTEVTVPVVPTEPSLLYLYGVALNNSGQVAVNVNDYGASTSHAYRWSTHEVATPVAPDAIGSRATGMNEAGQIVGIITVKAIEDGNPAVEQAFATRRYSGSVVLLGESGDGNAPTDINNWSQITGTNIVDGARHGYVTAPFNVMHAIDLDTLDEVTRNEWSNLRPAAINNRGQITGTGTYNGNDLAFLLTPQSLHAYLPRVNGKQPQCYRFRTQ